MPGGAKAKNSWKCVKMTLNSKWPSQYQDLLYLLSVWLYYVDYHSEWGFLIKYIFLRTFKILNEIFFFGNVEIQDGCVRKCVQLHIIISHGYSYSSSIYQCVMLVYVLNIFALNPRKGLIQYSKGLRMYITIPSSIRLVIIIIMTKRRPKSAIQPHIHFYLQRIL